MNAWPSGFGRLPRCPGWRLPIPFSSGRNDDGTGRFGVNDPDAKLACAIGELCSVCSGPFGGRPMVFLCADRGGDPDRLLFTDPPAHEDCAAASMRVCPHIARGGAGKPGWLWLASSSYELAAGRPPAVRFTFRPARPALAVRRFGYDDRGRLAER